jgi:hypothetical protein
MARGISTSCSNRNGYDPRSFHVLPPNFSALPYTLGTGPPFCLHNMLSTHRHKKPRTASPLSTDEAQVVTILPPANSQYTSIIPTMPPELLSIIFLFYHQDKQERFQVVESGVYNGPWEIGTVCRSWRAAARCYTTLWDVIGFCPRRVGVLIDGAFEERIKEGLKRAKNAKLDLRLDLTSVSLADGENLLRLLIPYSSQWDEFTLAFDLRFCPVLSATGYDMSSLRSLYLFYPPEDEDSHESKRPDEFLTFFSGASHLKTVYLGNLCPTAELMLPSEALEELTVTVDVGMDIALWEVDPADYNGLQRFVNLRFLDLSDDGREVYMETFNTSQDSILQDLIILPQLEMLGISTSLMTEAFVLPRLRTPSLRHLQIKHVDAANWETFFASIGHCVASQGGASVSLRHLEITTYTTDTSILDVLGIVALQNVEELSVNVKPHPFVTANFRDIYAEEVPKLFTQLFRMLVFDSAISEIRCMPNMKFLRIEFWRNWEQFVEADVLGHLLVDMIASRRVTHTVHGSTSSSEGSVSSLEEVLLRFKGSRFLKPFISDEVRERLRGLRDEGLDIVVSDGGTSACLRFVCYPPLMAHASKVAVL